MRSRRSTCRAMSMSPSSASGPKWQPQRGVAGSCGTLWPDRYTTCATVPTSGGADPPARERGVLGLAAVVRIGPAFSAAEQDRARAAAARDPRLRVALEATGYGLTQTLAAAPQLAGRWEDAETVDPYAWAVLTAALDAARPRNTGRRDSARL